VEHHAIVPGSSAQQHCHRHTRAQPFHMRLGERPIHVIKQVFTLRMKSNAQQAPHLRDLALSSAQALPCSQLCLIIKTKMIICATQRFNRTQRAKFTKKAAVILRSSRPCACANDGCVKQRRVNIDTSNPKASSGWCVTLQHLSDCHDISAADESVTSRMRVCTALAQLASPQTGTETARS
jgi:hypothetical protein